MFPPEYQSHGIKIKYNGEEVELTPEQEEIATFYAVMMETDYAKMDRFNENFFKSFKESLGENHKIKEFEKIDFTPIFEWSKEQKEIKKNLSREVIILRN